MSASDTTRGARLGLLPAALCLFAALCPPAAAQFPEPLNAALYYWKAIGLLQEPASRDDFRTIRFVEEELPGLPPTVLAVRPDLLAWLLRDRPAMAALDEAGRHTLCMFPIRIPGEVALDLSHLPRLRILAQRALSLSKAYEFVDNPEGAANLYANLFRMAQRLDQDKCMSSGLMACHVMNITVDGLEGFVSRTPPRAAADLLTAYFRGAPERVFHPGDYLREEERRYEEWLSGPIDRSQDRLSQLYGNARSKPAVEKLITLPKEKKAQRLLGWVKDYRDRMKLLASAFDKPFAAGLPVIQRSDAEKAAMQDALSHGGDNPLVPLLMPTAAELYQRFLLAEAQFDMANILCASAEFRAESGLWPANLQELSQFSHRVFPKDPFSGKDYYYTTHRGFPLIITRVPKTLAGRAGLKYEIDLSTRRLHDEQRHRAAIRQFQDEARREIAEPVPME